MKSSILKFYEVFRSSKLNDLIIFDENYYINIRSGDIKKIFPCERFSLEIVN